MDSVDKRLLHHIANEVADHKFTRVIGDLTKLQYHKGIGRCDYCLLPNNRLRCHTCDRLWCHRDYFCERPQNNKGVMMSSCECGGDHWTCVACYKKCQFEGCETKGCNQSHNAVCVVNNCYRCRKPTCRKHAPTVVIKNYGYDETTWYYCEKCVPVV